MVSSSGPSNGIVLAGSLVFISTHVDTRAQYLVSNCGCTSIRFLFRATFLAVIERSVTRVLFAGSENNV